MNAGPHHLTILAMLSVVAARTSLNAASPSSSPSPAPSVQTAITAPTPTNPAKTSAPTPTPSPTKESLVTREIPDIRGKISLPAGWTFLPGKLLEGDVLLAVREKITGENDPWTTGLSMTIDRNGAKDSGMKAGEYALGIAKEAREKAGEEASPLSDSNNGSFREIRFEFPVQAEPPLQVTEVLRANDQTGTVAVILWQTPKAESDTLRELRETVLSGLVLDPAL
jgi:hypothetical protein